MFRNSGLDSDPMALPNGIDFIHDFKPFIVVWPIDGTDVHDIIEIHRGIITKKSTNIMNNITLHGDGDISSPFVLVKESVRKPLLNVLR